MTQPRYTVEWYSRALNRIAAAEYDDYQQAVEGYQKKSVLPTEARVALYEHIYYSDGDHFRIQLIP